MARPYGRSTCTGPPSSYRRSTNAWSRWTSATPARSSSRDSLEEDLAGVADVHLLQAFVERRYEDGGPVQVDRPYGLAMPQEPIGERLSRTVITARTEAGEPVGDAELVGPAQIIGAEEAGAEVERGGQGARPEFRGPPVWPEEDDARLAAEEVAGADPPAEVGQVG